MNSIGKEKLWSWISTWSSGGGTRSSDVAKFYGHASSIGYPLGTCSRTWKNRAWGSKEWAGPLLTLIRITFISKRSVHMFLSIRHASIDLVTYTNRKLESSWFPGLLEVKCLTFILACRHHSALSSMFCTHTYTRAFCPNEIEIRKSKQMRPTCENLGLEFKGVNRSIFNANSKHFYFQKLCTCILIDSSCVDWHSYFTQVGNLSSHDFQGY